jgi:hypothetical protein
VLCESDTVRHISFTGSTEVGRILMAQSAPTVKKLSLELGGNAPFIVFDDADIDSAVEGAMASKYRNAGQTCVCANRIYVQDGVYDAFVEKFAAKVKALKVGNGFEDGVVQGPLIEDAAVEKVQRHVADAVAKGGKLLAGGHKLRGPVLRADRGLPTPPPTCCAPAKKPSAPSRRCSASRPSRKPSTRPTTPSSAWPATSTAATSAASSAWRSAGIRHGGHQRRRDRHRARALRRRQAVGPGPRRLAATAWTTTSR